MKRIPDPLTYNEVFYRIMQAYTTQTYGTKNIEECPLEDLLKYDYNISNMKIEGKLRHYAENMTHKNLYRAKDILVEKQQHDGRDDGWFFECEADRIFYIKILYHNTCPTHGRTILTKRSDIKEFTFIDCSWSEIKQLIQNNKYELVYSGKTTGSWNWIVPLHHLKDVKIWKHAL